MVVLCCSEGRAGDLSWVARCDSDCGIEERSSRSPGMLPQDDRWWVMRVSQLPPIRVSIRASVRAHDLSFRAQVFRSVGISLGSLAAHAGHPAHGVDEVEGKGHRTFRPTEIVCQPAAGKQVTKKIPWQ